MSDENYDLWCPSIDYKWCVKCKCKRQMMGWSEGAGVHSLRCIFCGSEWVYGDDGTFLGEYVPPKLSKEEIDRRMRKYSKFYRVEAIKKEVEKNE